MGRARARFVLAAVGVVGAMTMAAGCASRVEGTWRSSGPARGGNVGFEFGAVTFARDGTYTAEMRYGGEIRVNTGGWRTEDGSLVLSDPARTYSYRLEGPDMLIITDPRTTIAVEMNRVKR